MKTIFKIIVLVSLLAMAASCDDSNENGSLPMSDPIKIELSNAEQKIVAAERENAVKIFSMVAKEEVEAASKENFMISPYSLNVALAMTWNGAKDETKAGIEKALGYDASYGAAINGYHKKMANALLKTDPSTKLAIANSIWYKQTATLKSDFKKVNEESYDAYVKGVDFTDSNTKNLMNNWCKEKTNGLIKDVIKKTDSDNLIFLMNALYFKGIWQEDIKFDASKTYQEDFTLENTTKVKVAMMHQKSEMLYSEDASFQSVALTYGNGAYSMVILLPKMGKTVTELSEELVQPGVFTQKMTQFANAKVDLYLPKFKFEYNKKLNEVLKTLGMEKAFLQSADFTDAFETANFYISKVNQFTYVDVNEKGTEAAAITVVEGVVTSVEPPQEATFKADRPFVFYIKENSTGTILFMGKVGNPNATNS